jgi:hypothetical protein
MPLEIPMLGPSLHEQLRLTGAIELLEAGKPDKFPLAEAQTVIDNFIQRRRVTPNTSECDVELIKALGDWEGYWIGQTAHIAACLHAMTYDTARLQLIAIRPRLEDADEPTFNHRVLMYLQAMWLAQKACPSLLTPVEAAVAYELLKVVRKKANSFREIGRLLGDVGKCEEMLSLQFVQKVFRHSTLNGQKRYSALPDELMATLETLREHGEWSKAVKVVDGLSQIVKGASPATLSLLREFFPRYVMWAVWRPNKRRILAWRDKVVGPYRARLARVFELEGPDTTGQQRRTLLAASPGAFVGTRQSDLEEMMSLLDRAIVLGPESIDLFLQLAVECDTTRIADGLEQVAAVFSLGAGRASTRILNLRQALLSNASPYDRANTLSAALPMFSGTARLQRAFTTSLRLPEAVAATFGAITEHLRQLRASDRPSGSYASMVNSLAMRLEAATWLHPSLSAACLASIKRYCAMEL